jgi:hypothetical protein
LWIRGVRTLFARFGFFDFAAELLVDVGAAALAAGVAAVVAPPATDPGLDVVPAAATAAAVTPAAAAFAPVETGRPTGLWVAPTGVVEPLGLDAAEVVVVVDVAALWGGAEIPADDMRPTAATASASTAASE